ncbi:MAG: SprT-like domain-containing protein [Propionibacteriaceae bacterium]|jgi:predicted SprT family Zn-dependent metalloprotease|nr:SprT-like domain-containing protein [Propionibacteriaceae bacterium]
MTTLAWAQARASELIGQHLTAWSFGFDHARARVGCCHYDDRQITLSRHLVLGLTAPEVDQAVLHEIAHAIAGPKEGHGPAWRRTAARLGYTGRRTMHVPDAREQARWVARCPKGHEYRRHRRPSRAAYCSPCSRAGQWHLLKWVDEKG